jgi:hypothetical protein
MVKLLEVRWCVTAFVISDPADTQPAARLDAKTRLARSGFKEPESTGRAAA